MRLVASFKRVLGTERAGRLRDILHDLATEPGRRGWTFAELAERLLDDPEGIRARKAGAQQSRPLRRLLSALQDACSVDRGAGPESDPARTGCRAAVYMTTPFHGWLGAQRKRGKTA